MYSTDRAKMTHVIAELRELAENAYLAGAWKESFAYKASLRVIERRFPEMFTTPNHIARD